MHAPPIAGIFVGGRSSRMDGRPKGLLPVGGETILARWRRILGAVGLSCVLVGENEAYAAYAASAADGLATLADEGSGGPIAGLRRLLDHARAADVRAVVAVACDMPYVSEALVRRLLAAPPAAAVAPRVDGLWQPFFARYDPAAVVVAPGARSLQEVLDAARASVLPLTPEEARELRDWDTPADVEPC